MGVSKDLAQSSLRIGFGRFTSLKEIKFACNEIVKNVNRIRGDHPTVRERAYGRESTMRTSP